LNSIDAATGYRAVPELAQRMAGWCALAFLAATIFSAPVRWILATIGLAPLAYLPIVGLLLFSLYVLVWQFVYGPFGARAFLACGLLVYSIAVGILMTPSPRQVLFAAYMLIPLYGGLLLAPQWTKMMDASRITLLLWWLAIVGAVVANPYIDYPWVGFEYSVGGVTVETGREWWSGDVQRYSGFSRASFDAAVQSVIFLILASDTVRHRILRLAMAAATCYCIWLTNSKTVIGVLALVVVCQEMPEAMLHRIRGVLVAFFVTVGCALPLIGWIYLPRLNAINTSSGLHSYEDRLRYMWPEAFDLWIHRGNWFTGRGLGGLGTAQNYFEPEIFNAGDNLHLYVCVSLGVVAIPLFIYIWTRVAQLSIERGSHSRRIFLISLVPLSYGLMVNVIENAMLSLSLGLFIRYACDTSTSIRQHSVSNSAVSG
jgi:hypothetical protein